MTVLDYSLEQVVHYQQNNPCWLSLLGKFRVDEHHHPMNVDEGHPPLLAKCRQHKNQVRSDRDHFVKDAWTTHAGCDRSFRRWNSSSHQSSIVKWARVVHSQGFPPTSPAPQSCEGDDGIGMCRHKSYTSKSTWGATHPCTKQTTLNEKIRLQNK